MSLVRLSGYCPSDDCKDEVIPFTYICTYCRYRGEMDDFLEISLDLYSGSDLYCVTRKPKICSGCFAQKENQSHKDYIIWRFLNPNEANVGPVKH